MQVPFKYNDGRVVHMDRVYADILQHLKHGSVQDTIADVPETPTVTIDKVGEATEDVLKARPVPIATVRAAKNNKPAKAKAPKRGRR